MAAAVGLVVLAGLITLRHVEASPGLRPSPCARGWWRWPWMCAGHAFVVNRSTRTTPGSVSMLDASTGAVLRTAPLAGDAAAVDGRAGRVFVADADNAAVHVLDARSGALLRTVVAGIDPAPVPLAADVRTHRVFVASGAPYFCCAASSVSVLDATSGRVLRRVTVDGNLGAIAADERTGHVFVTALDDVTSHTTGTVSMLDAANGAVLRMIPTLAPSAIAASARTGRVFILSSGVPPASSGTVSVLIARSGALLCTTHLSTIPLDLAVDERDRHVFVTNVAGVNVWGHYQGAGSVSMLDATSGRLLRTIALDSSPAGIAVDERMGRVFVTARRTTTGSSGEGSLSILDGRRGAIVRTIPLDSPGALAVDERSGHVFVIDDQDSVHVSNVWGWVPGWLRHRLPSLLLPTPRTHTIPPHLTVLNVS